MTKAGDKGNPVQSVCRNCGESFWRPSNRRRQMCSKSCLAEWKRQNVPPALIRFNKTVRREQMKENNPMKDPETREKMKTSLRSMNWRPPKQGGNGREAPLPQRLIAHALGWPMEVVVKTEVPRGNGYPTCYKLDVANETLKVGVEIDGGSHNADERKEQDAKKDEFLASKGWSVLRFTNEEVLGNLEGCVQTVMSTISK